MRPVWKLPLDPDGIDMKLDNGVVVRVRPFRADDRDGLLDAFDRFSTHSRYMRFFSGITRLSDALATSLTDIDHQKQIAWAVFDPGEPSRVGDGSGLAVASARLFMDAAGASEAEATLAVVDDYQRQGLGRFLIELLVSTAAMREITILRFEVLAENRGVRRLLGNVGATSAAIPGDRTVLEYTLPVPHLDSTDPTAGALYELLRMRQHGGSGR